VNARLFCTCTGALNRPRAGEAGALILRAEEPGFGDAGQADGAAVWIFSDHRTLGKTGMALSSPEDSWALPGIFYTLSIFLTHRAHSEELLLILCAILCL